MKYEVLVTRDTTESSVIVVEAESKEEAGRDALDKAGGFDRPNAFYMYGWKINDNDPSEAYLGSGVDDDVTPAAEVAKGRKIIW